MHSRYSHALLGAVVVFGCGGGGGDDELLVDVSQAQAVALCQQLATEYPVKTVSCGSDGSSTVGQSGSACSGSGIGSGLLSTCKATVGDADGCFEAFYDNPCDLFAALATPACQAVDSPSCQGSDDN